MGDKSYFVYILTNQSGTVLYVGVTNNIYRRMHEHRNKVISGFTAKYNVSKLVYYEHFPSVYEAITAEKTLKGWRREKKVDLIRTKNPTMVDLLDTVRDPSFHSG